MERQSQAAIFQIKRLILEWILRLQNLSTIQSPDSLTSIHICRDPWTSSSNRRKISKPLCFDCHEWKSLEKLKDPLTQSIPEQVDNQSGIPSLLLEMEKINHKLASFPQSLCLTKIVYQFEKLQLRPAQILAPAVSELYLLKKLELELVSPSIFF